MSVERLETPEGWSDFAKTGIEGICPQCAHEEHDHVIRQWKGMPVRVCTMHRAWTRPYKVCGCWRPE